MNQRRNALLWLLILFTLFHFVHDVAKFVKDNPFIDIGHYMFYTTLVARGGNPMVASDVERLRSEVDYRFSTAPAHYPPFFYIYMRPLTWMSFDTAKIVWLVLMVILLFAAPILVTGLQHFNKKDPESWIPYVLLLWAQPVYEDLGIGQSNILLFFLLALACWFLRKNQPFPAGVIFAFTAMTKLHYGLFGLYYLWKRDWAVFRGIAAGGLVFGLIGLAGTSLQQHIDLVKFVSHPTADLMTLPTNISVAGVIARSVSNPTLASLLSLLAIAAVVVPLIRSGRRRTGLSPVFDVSMVLLLIPLLSPLVEDFHLIPLFITFYVLDREGGVWQSRTRSTIWVLAYLIIASRFSFADFERVRLGPGSIILSAKILGVAMLYWLSLTVWSTSRMATTHERSNPDNQVRGSSQAG